MNEKKFLTEFRKMRGSRINDIIHAVNFKIPKAEAGLKNEVERRYYDNLTKEAQNHEKEYGFWPAFDMVEIETDDPRLDIYSGSADGDMDEIDEV